MREYRFAVTCDRGKSLMWTGFLDDSASLSAILIDVLEQLTGSENQPTIFDMAKILVTYIKGMMQSYVQFY